MNRRNYNMATNYFRVTGYHPTEDLSVVMDSSGKFEKLWQLSAYLLQKGFKIIEASSDEKFLDVNITKSETEPDKLVLRAYAKGAPEYVTHELDGKPYRAVKVGDRIYIPDREKTV
jgi:hypothetical protein